MRPSRKYSALCGAAQLGGIRPWWMPVAVAVDMRQTLSIRVSPKIPYGRTMRIATSTR